MAKRFRGRRARHHPLSIRDRDILIFWYANPDLTRRKLSSLLLLSPGELSRLLRLKEGKELINDLIQTSAPRDFWPEYRLDDANAGDQASRLLTTGWSPDISCPGPGTIEQALPNKKVRYY